MHERLEDLGYGKRNIIGKPRKVPKDKPGKCQFTVPLPIDRLLPNMQLVNSGPLIYSLMQLNLIPAEDIELLIPTLNPTARKQRPPIYKRAHCAPDS